VITDGSVQIDKSRQPSGFCEFQVSPVLRQKFPVETCLFRFCFRVARGRPPNMDNHSKSASENTYRAETASGE
jgi:hypothetical protein